MNEINSCDTSTEARQLKYLLLIGIAVMVIVGISLWISPYFFIEDESALYRYALLKFPQMMIDIFALLAAIVVFDFITPEDSLCTIYKDSMATSVLYSALVIASAIAIAFG